MENKSRGDIFGNSSAPFINGLAKANAAAMGYHDSYVHPSEPNYLEMVAGENFGILDDNDPASHSIDATSHIADQLELAGLTWKAYEEGMGDACGLVSHGRYAAKHDPFVYFDDINGWDGKQFQPSTRCQEHVVDFSQLDADIAAKQIPKYAFITPNLDDDMHDGTIAQGDLWLSTEIPKLMATDAYKNNGVIFLLWDEGSGSVTAGDDPPFIAISPMIVAGMQSKTIYDTSSYLKTVEGILGVDSVPCAKDPSSVSAMSDLFTVPVAAAAAAH
jgi:acid phosphatase